MGKIESFNIDMRPFEWGGNKMYEVRVRVDGELLTMCNVVANQAPHEAEIEVLFRIGQKMISNLRDREKHSHCCDCCSKKTKCCANTC